MGFYNVRDDLYVGIFPKAANINKGGISDIAQSGSAFTALCHNANRLGFNLCVPSDNEMAATLMLLQNSPRTSPGKIATIRESGDCQLDGRSGS